MQANAVLQPTAISRTRSVTNETANTATHAAGLLASLIGSAFLLPVAYQSNGWVFWGCVIYAATLIALYAASTLSHAISQPRRKAFWKMMDQVCIFLLIAGNFTPVVLAHMRSPGWLLLLGLSWAWAFAGSYARIRLGNRCLAIAWYLPMGWLPIFAFGEMVSIGGVYGGTLVLVGGLSYTLGTWFLANDERHPLYHTVWHVSTLIGSTLHYLYVYEFIAT